LLQILEAERTADVSTAPRSEATFTVIGTIGGRNSQDWYLQQILVAAQPLDGGQILINGIVQFHDDQARL